MKMFTKLAAIACAMALLPAVHAQDYVAISIEAEDFSQKNSLWRVFSNNSTPNVNPDPDGSHHSTASGRAYVELLPDTRVTHSDNLSTGSNFWNTAGTGPELSYIVNIPEAGRYIVFAKAYSTGTEDNGIHVGLNNSNPASGHRMQWCNGKNNWTWSSAQRTSSNHCGVQRSIYLDIPVAGANTIVFTAREDGFELDQFMLLKEKTAGLNCSPNANDQITCNQTASGDVSDNTPPSTQNDDNTNSSDGFQQCSSANSDPDGDGYGWENGQTCLTAATGNNSDSNSGNNGNAAPLCTSADSDEDGDGWGWENNQSCIVAASAGNSVTDSTETPICQQASSDPDHDGWGWENSRSCIVQ